jgi:hypothetical protein
MSRVWSDRWEDRPVRYICRRCGVPCGWWFFGWRHVGAGVRHTCGLRAEPIEKGRHG